MNEALIAATGIAVGYVVAVALHRRRGAATPGSTLADDGSTTEHASEPSIDEPTVDESGADAVTAAVGQPVVSERDLLYRAAEEIELFFRQSAHPRDLLGQPAFEKGAALLESATFTTTDLVGYAAGDNPMISCMALEALMRRDRDPELAVTLIGRTSYLSNWPRWFALRLFETHADGDVIAQLLPRIDVSWSSPFAEALLEDFLRRRLVAGERTAFDDRMAALPREGLDWLEQLLSRPGLDPLLTSLREWKSKRIDTTFLQSFGRVWTQKDVEAAIVEDDDLLSRSAEMRQILARVPPRSLVLIGEDGVGKTTSLRHLARGLLADGWTLFEAGASELLAGQIYFGALEQRLADLLKAIGGKPRLLWIVPELAELAWAGRHKYGQTSVLDFLLPHVESGKVCVLGEASPTAYEQLVQEKPRVRGALEAIAVEPANDADAHVLALRWAVLHALPDGAPACDRAVVLEAHKLAQQYFGDQAQPGNLLHLLELTRQAHVQAGEGGPIERRHLLLTLSRLTGLPLSLLDEQASLDLGALRRFFAARVLGQDEAVDCLVERVAMIKAGVTDPGRPPGVFLFSGTTGTGKTEIAKTLAEFLFGSAQRLIRLDMSEFQTADSLGRILGEADDDGRRGALVHAIRKHPFSVVLLDEIEKAHPAIWDLFLAVFDAGRLTDRRGKLADFRHAIVIMTSNLGARPPQASGLGFGAVASAPHDVHRALAREFRPEFLNRIDRVVVFRPLSRPIMRGVLEKELAQALQRRGLRNRQWAVEWDESALEFLLTQGFSEELGARPLKRAIERYVLAPLAMTIVNHEAPAGDQFLFVRSDGRAIEVEFIDPEPPADEPRRDGSTTEVDGAAGEAAELRLETVVLDGSGSPAEVAFLEQRYGRTCSELAAPAWRDRKAAALAAIAEPDFWSSPGRFAVLGLAEYMDRIETGAQTAGNLLRRLTGGQRTRYAVDLVQRLAQQLYLVDAARTALGRGQPADAYLRIEAMRDPYVDAAATDAFAARLEAMYRQWAHKRRMQLEVLEQSDGGAFRSVLAVGGFGAFSILASENGLHVLEMPDENSTRRCRVRVSLAPQPDGPGLRDRAALLDAARAALAGAVSRPDIVRRYRDAPSPLVRDGVKGWRTGRLERVLGGDFDLIG